MTVTEALRVTGPSVPQAAVGAPFTTTVRVVGGLGPYSWARQGRRPPRGVALSRRHACRHAGDRGTPYVQGRRHRLPGQHAAQSRSTIVVRPRLKIPVQALAPATAGRPYRARILTRGGAAPLTFEIAKGQLPAGVSLSPSDRHALAGKARVAEAGIHSPSASPIGSGASTGGHSCSPSGDAATGPRGRARSSAPRYSSSPADVAQLVEHFTRNEGVPGSSPGVGFRDPCGGLGCPAGAGHPSFDSFLVALASSRSAPGSRHPATSSSGRLRTAAVAQRGDELVEVPRLDALADAVRRRRSRDDDGGRPDRAPDGARRGHAGVPAGPLPRFEHRNSVMPPLTPSFAKWICACWTLPSSRS